MSAKHSKEKTKKNNFKFLVFFTLLAIIVFMVYIYLTRDIDSPKDIVKDISSEIKKDIIRNENTIETSNTPSVELIEIANQSDIKNSNNLIVNGINVTKNSDTKYMISSTVNNNSSENQEKISVVLYLYNSEKKEIASINFYIDNIIANGKSTLFTMSNLDLSDCKYYNMIIKE